MRVQQHLYHIRINNLISIKSKYFFLPPPLQGYASETTLATLGYYSKGVSCVLSSQPPTTLPTPRPPAQAGGQLDYGVGGAPGGYDAGWYNGMDQSQFSAVQSQNIGADCGGGCACCEVEIYPYGANDQCTAGNSNSNSNVNQGGESVVVTIVHCDVEQGGTVSTVRINKRTESIAS